MIALHICTFFSKVLQTLIIGCLEVNCLKKIITCFSYRIGSQPERRHKTRQEDLNLNPSSGHMT